MTLLLQLSFLHKVGFKSVLLQPIGLLPRVKVGTDGEIMDFHLQVSSEDRTASAAVTHMTNLKPVKEHP